MNRRRFLEAAVLSGVAGVAGCAGSPLSNVSEQWQFETEGRIEHTPALAGSTVYLGDSTGMISAIDVSDGSRLWHYDTSQRTTGSPTVAEENVYVGNNTLLYKLSADGTEEWSYEVNAGVRTASVDDDKVYFGTDITTRGVIALDKESGSKHWEYNPGTGVNLQAAPLALEDRVLFGDSDGTILCLDTADGELHWSAPADDGPHSTPVHHGGEIYLGSGVDSLDGGHVVALDLESGEQQWTTEFDAKAPIFTPAVTDDAVYIGCFDGTIVSLDRSTGDERWSQETGETSSSGTTTDFSVSVRDDIVYTAGADGSLHALATADGSQQWRFDPSEDVRSRPLVDGRLIYAGCNRSVIAVEHS